MTPDDMDLLAALARNRAGLRIESDKAYLVESRLNPLARREGFESIEAMVAALRAKRDDRLIWAVVEALTLNETAFFRDREVFAHLRDELLPALSRRRDRPIRIWSAACSTGQEVYSLAMTASEARDIEPGAQFEFFGSDLSERCLEKAQSGLYTQFEVQRGLPIRSLVKHFENQDEMWAISPRIRQAVRWRRINLMADLSPMGKFDAILLRNVLPGLDPAVRPRVVESLAARLEDDGVLLLGAGESLGELTGAVRPLADRLGLFSRDPSFRAAA
ncbi:methylase of chemotaxis methyl-accepting protein [Caulobacter sp. AP07]|uniref:CheR family methyltransferase n=1 Tax=Caulobacter sp. AP07 TaxID=1144304 RepID=UPI000271F708|nr:protein-glutamate O-methyltransferase CheR [Caulobacter sp. AP07]EJL37394.1 methylase of chemotaxis methyl-accepting protein [Caulobacter sp. AP07]